MLQTFMLICHLWNSLISLWDLPVPPAWFFTDSLGGQSSQNGAFVTNQLKFTTQPKSSRIDISGEGDGDGEAARRIPCPIHNATHCEHECK